MLATSAPVTASSISSRSISSACCFAAAPTPSASSTDSALGAICRPTPASPNSAACSSTSDWKPCRASASAQASPPMPPPAMATGHTLRVPTGIQDQSASPAVARSSQLLSPVSVFSSASASSLVCVTCGTISGSPSPFDGWQENSSRMSFGSNT